MKLHALELMFRNQNHGEKTKQVRRNDTGAGEGYITTDDGIRLFFQKLGSGQRAEAGRILLHALLYCSDWLRRPIIPW